MPSDWSEVLESVDEFLEGTVLTVAAVVALQELQEELQKKIDVLLEKLEDEDGEE